MPPDSATALPTSQRARPSARWRIFLPFISLIYGSILPAGLFLYWIGSTIFSIAQQYLIIGWGGMFPLFGWTPGFAVGPCPALPGRRRPGGRTPCARGG